MLQGGDPKQIANAFTKVFANIGNKLAKSIPTVPQTPFQYLKTPTCNSFALFPATREEIEREIFSLKTGKAIGPSSIPTRILKIVKSIISKPLELIFIASSRTGIVPADFKLANIVPVHKA